MKKVKISVIPNVMTLYFCPYCKRGHQVNKYITHCDICGGEIDWSEVKGD